MGGEDFAFYTQRIPGAMIFLGHGDPATNAPLHNPNFLIDDSVLPRGALFLAELAVEYLHKGGFQDPVNMATETCQAAPGEPSSPGACSTAGSEAGREEL